MMPYIDIQSRLAKISRRNPLSTPSHVRLPLYAFVYALAFYNMICFIVRTFMKHATRRHYYGDDGLAAAMSTMPISVTIQPPAPSHQV